MVRTFPKVQHFYHNLDKWLVVNAGSVRPDVYEDSLGSLSFSQILIFCLSFSISFQVSVATLEYYIYHSIMKELLSEGRVITAM